MEKAEAKEGSSIPERSSKSSSRSSRKNVTKAELMRRRYIHLGNSHAWIREHVMRFWRALKRDKQRRGCVQKRERL